MTVNDLEEYSGSHQDIKIERHNGILEVTFGIDRTLIWSLENRQEIIRAFSAIASDEENKIVILSGNGASFWKEEEDVSQTTPKKEDWQVGSVLESVLKVEVPVIAAVNGSVRQYCEIPLLSDVVLASENAEFQDIPSNVLQFPSDKEVRRLALFSLLGPNRARYFLLTGKSLSAKDAKKAGLVAEILHPKDVLNRAREMAFMLIRRPPGELRRIRMSFIHEIKSRIEQSVGSLRAYGDFSQRSESDKEFFKAERLKLDSPREKAGKLSTDFNSLSLNEQDELRPISSSYLEGDEVTRNTTSDPVDQQEESDDDLETKEYDGFSLHGNDIGYLAASEKEGMEVSPADEGNEGGPSAPDWEKAEWELKKDDAIPVEHETDGISSFDEVAGVISSVSTKGGENDVKLNLAKAYVELGYYPSAQFLLEEIVEEGDLEQIKEAELLKQQIARSQQ